MFYIVVHHLFGISVILYFLGVCACVFSYVCVQA